MKRRVREQKGILGIFVVAMFLLFVIVFYAVIGEKSYISVQDNLDLFMAQFAMLKNEGIFFAHGASAPFLGGVSRDVLNDSLGKEAGDDLLRFWAGYQGMFFQVSFHYTQFCS